MRRIIITLPAVIMLVHAVPNAVVAQDTAPSPREYASVIAVADSVYGSLRLVPAHNGIEVAIVSDSSIKIVDGTSRNTELMGGSTTCNRIYKVAWSPDDQELAVICRGGTLSRWRTDSRTDKQRVATNVVQAGWVGPDTLLYAQRAIDPIAPVVAAESTQGQKCEPKPYRTCSDSVDVFRFEATTRARDERRDATRRDGTMVRFVISSRDTSLELGMLRGVLVQLLVDANSGRALVIMRDSLAERYRGTTSFGTLYSITQNQITRLRGDLTFVGWERERWRWDISGERVVTWPSYDRGRTSDTLQLIPLRPNQKIANLAVQHRTAAVASPPFSHGNSWDPPLPTGTANRVFVNINGSVWSVDALTLSARLLHAGNDTSVVHLGCVNKNEWSSLVMDKRTGRSGVMSVDLVSDIAQVSWLEQAMPHTAIVTCNPSVDRFFVISPTKSEPYNVFALSLNRKPSRQLVVRELTGAAFSRSLPAASDTIITFLSDGVLATAFLVRSPNSYAPRPTIVHAYPGGLTAARYANMPGYSEPLAVYESIRRGFVYAYVDIPLAPYGRYGAHGPADQITRGMQNAVDAIVKTGWVDNERLGVVGFSYGGTMVNTLVTTMPNAFGAAVSVAGHSDFISGVFGSHWSDGGPLTEGQGRMEVPFFEDPVRYIDNSPIRRLDQVITPLLLIHGARDHVVEVGQSFEMFNGLTDLGKTAEFVRYNNVAHDLIPSMWSRAFDWFEKHLKPTNE